MGPDTQAGGEPADEDLARSALDAYRSGDLPGAERAFRRLLEREERNGVAHHNLANLLRQSGRLEEAQAHYRRALEQMPDSAQIHEHLASTLDSLHRHDEAEAEYRRALDLQPDFAQARFNLGLLLLAAGRYAEAWPLYEARAQLYREHGTLPFPQWRGEDLRGKSLLLLPEQGYGDTLQFIRYVPLLKAQGVAHLSVVCKPKLAPVLRTVQGIDALITEPQQLRAHDYWDSLLSLPCRFRTTLESIPATIPYVGVYTNRLDAWRERLPRDGVRVGLVWKGNPGHDNDAVRSLRHFADLRPLWSVGGVRFVSLQVGDAEAETQACAAEQPILCLGHEIRDFGDTAAIVAQLNLVICVDTAVAHLAGALGVACWVMLPQTGVDWRWHRSGAQSPWYPKDMYLFRQRQPEWPALIHDVRDALADVIAKRP
jgi:tetratricopeptide (TPR) repeat protein